MYPMFPQYPLQFNSMCQHPYVPYQANSGFPPGSASATAGIYGQYMPANYPGPLPYGYPFQFGDPHRFGDPNIFRDGNRSENPNSKPPDGKGGNQPSAKEGKPANDKCDISQSKEMDAMCQESVRAKQKDTDDSDAASTSPDNSGDSDTEKNAKATAPEPDAPPARFHDAEPNTAALRHYLMSDRRSRKHYPGLTRSQKVIIKKQADKFRVKKGKLFFLTPEGEERLYVETEKERLKILEEYHERFSHSRRDRLIQRLKQVYHWKTMRADVEKFVSVTAPLWHLSSIIGFCPTSKTNFSIT